LRRDQSQQKRVLLDQITEQLRIQLHTLDNGGGRTSTENSQSEPAATPARD
jgi:hypothetical protein